MESKPNEKSNEINDSHSDRIVKIGYVVLLTIGAALVFSLCMTFLGSYAQTANQHISSSLTSDLVLDVVYPRSLLFDDSSASVLVSLTAADSVAFTQPVTVSFFLPPSIVMSDTVSNEWVFEEENGRYQQTAFFIQNTGILQGLIPPYQTQALTVTNALNSLLPITPSIRVETTAAAAIRQFMLGLLQDKSPLLLTIAALLPITALLLQQLQRQEEKEKAAREQQLTAQKQRLYEQEAQLRHYLTEGDRAGVQSTWQQINQSLLKEISPRKYQSLKILVCLCLTGELDQEGQTP